MTQGDVLQLEAVTKRYGETQVVTSSSLTIAKGEVYTLLGPSGCGKTTTLRMVAGLEAPSGGRIIYEGRVMADPARGIFVPPHKRGMGMVFQSYAIWPHMTVFENIAYPLRLRGVAGDELRRRVEKVLDLVGMTALMDRPAPMLSGGQQQRVSLCRALVYEPDLLLLDEPFSNLDAKLRVQMRVEVGLLQRRLGFSVLFVTHDQIEALTLSDRIAVMSEGRIEQVGTPQEIYDHPASPFVRDFLGQTVLIRGTLAADAEAESPGVVVAGGAGTAPCVVRAGNNALNGAASGSAVSLSIRPEDVVLKPADQVTENSVQGLVDSLVFVGDRIELQVTLQNGDAVLLNAPRSGGWAPGQTIRLECPVGRTFLWPA